MWRAIPDIIKVAARKLRKNMTTPEELLWDKLKTKKIGYRIIRQSPIYVFTENSWLDRYIIADFYCPEKKLIIEIDGSIHSLKDIYLLDREKEILLTQAWYFVIRFDNSQVHANIAEVLNRIKNC